MSRRKIKSDQRADTRGAGFTGLPHVVHDSLAYRHLDLWGRAVLSQIIRRFNGYNNGKIAVSQREIADELRTTNFRKIARAFAELVEHGLLDVTTEGQWKERMAREYRLTFISTSSGGNHRQATNEYLAWTPLQRKSGADDVSAATDISAEDVSAERQKPADDVSARIAQHRRKTVDRQKTSADDVSTLIDKPYPEAIPNGIVGNGRAGPWHPNDHRWAVLRPGRKVPIRSPR
jgi:hypothetical protein